MYKFVLSVFTFIVFLPLLANTSHAQQDVAVVAPVSETGEDFDLYGVSQLFKDSEDLEAFEKAINDPANEVNNLDLNEDGQVDYIRVVEYSEDNTRVIVMQATLGDNEYQDVATIQIEKNSEEDYVLQAIGNEEVYGEEYIVEPDQSSTTTVVHVHTYPVMLFVFRPGRGLWISPWGWGRYPGWWGPRAPVARSVHRSRVTRWHRNTAFRTTKVKRTTRSRNVYSKHRKSSTLNKRKATPATTQKKTTAKKQTTKKQTTQKKGGPPASTKKQPTTKKKQQQPPKKQQQPPPKKRP